MLSNFYVKHFLIGFFILTLLYKKALSGPRYSSRIVEIESGAIRGIIVELNSRYLEPVEVFRGVPYAAAPVGPLRFRPPQPPPAWPGTRLADTFGPSCPQNHPDISNKTIALQFIPRGRYNYLRKLLPLLTNQSEDCLFLNIYVPGSGNRGLEAPYAVLVFIHGEAFNWGAGHPYDGSVLASYGHVIVITINFRLGVLGFLRTSSIGHKTETDNLGLKDISAALRWINSNIAAFGGDSKRVTLMGHDTGAALANLLLVSPFSKGLIRRVILLSGTALSPWAVVHNTDNLLVSIGHQTGCLSSDSLNIEEDLAACLRSRPLKVLLNLELEVMKFMPKIGPSLPIDPSTPDPLYEMEHTSENFITNEIMLGITTTESYNDFNAADIQYGFEEDQRNRILRTFVRNTFFYHLNEIFSAIRNEYTDWDKPIQHPINIRDSTMEALSDGHTVSPLIRVAYLHARRGAKTYLAHFGYQTKDSDYPQRLGSVKGEDLPYYLGTPLIGGVPFFPHNYSRQDIAVAETVLYFLCNFIKNGNPNSPSVHIADYENLRDKIRYPSVTWEPYEIGSQYYLSITSKSKLKSHYRGHKMAVWLNLIPQLHQPGDADVSMRHHHFHEREPHYYIGAVRAETFTQIPLSLHQNSISHSHHQSQNNNECIFNSSTKEDDTEENQNVNINLSITAEEGQEEDSDVLEKLTRRHYYSYTTALGVTVGVGCLLLILNMLIFIGIYYQRDRDRRKQNSYRSNSSTTATPETLQMSQRQSIPVSLANQPPLKNKNILYPYTKDLYAVPDKLKKKDKPLPPVRTSSSISEGMVKKRVHVHEISV